MDREVNQIRKEIIELKVIIDTLQQALGRARSVIPESDMDYVFTQSAKWAGSYGKEGE